MVSSLLQPQAAAGVQLSPGLCAGWPWGAQSPVPLPALGTGLATEGQVCLQDAHLMLSLQEQSRGIAAQQDW